MFFASIVMPRSRSWSLRVEHAFGHLLVVAEDVRGLQQAIDQRRLAVVDVRDDGDVADVGLAHEAPKGAGMRASARVSGHERSD